MKLFTTITDLSNHTGPLAHLADTLLSLVAPQNKAEALLCTKSENAGCCGYRSIRYRRKCFYPLPGPLPGFWRTEYYCVAASSSCA